MFGHLPRTSVALALIALAGLAVPTAAAPSFGKMEKGKPFSGGFRMEGTPKVDDLFGDTLAFSARIDRYLALYDAMQRVRDRFSRSLQTVMTTLAAQKTGNPVCPIDSIALGYAQSYHLGQDFQRSGGELERLFIELRDLDRLGETGGLTPDYRWKVRRALGLHKEVLVDWNEMKASFYEHLGKELAFFKCDLKLLIERGEAASALAPAPSEAAPMLPTSPAPKQKPRKGPEEAPPPIAASASFTVDNTSCATAIQLTLDGQLVGQVAGHARRSITTLVGPHDLCLIPEGAPQQCGDLGTLRRAYIHQGWTIQLRCAP